MHTHQRAPAEEGEGEAFVNLVDDSATQCGGEQGTAASMAGASMGLDTVSPAHSGAGEGICMAQTQTKLTGIPLSQL